MRSSGHYSVASREKSPARQKAEQLTEQLQYIGQEEDTKGKREALVQRARQIYEKMEKTEQLDESRVRVLNDQLLKISDDLNEERSIRESFEQEKKEALTLLEKEFTQLTGEYKKEVIARENHLEGKIDERFLKIRSEIVHEQKKRVDGQNEMLRNVSDHIAELNGMIAAQRKSRYFRLNLEKTATSL